MIKSKKYRAAAEGQQCTMNIVGVCNYQDETVVFAHFPDESHGMAIKSDDLSGADVCSACHDVIDGRVIIDEFNMCKNFYMRRGQTRTLRRRFGQGILKIA